MLLVIAVQGPKEKLHRQLPSLGMIFFSQGLLVRKNKVFEYCRLITPSFLTVCLVLAGLRIIFHSQDTLQVLPKELTDCQEHHDAKPIWWQLPLLCKPLLQLLLSRNWLSIVLYSVLEQRLMLSTLTFFWREVLLGFLPGSLTCHCFLSTVWQWLQIIKTVFCSALYCCLLLAFKTLQERY